MNYAAEASVQPPSPLTDTVLERLKYFNQAAGEAQSIANAIRDRLFGAQPEAPSAPTVEAVPNGLYDMFQVEAERLFTRLNSLDSALRSINARL